MSEIARDDAWMCGAIQSPVRDPYRPFRCTDPYDHVGLHRAVIDDETVAEWPSRSPSTESETPQP